MYGMQWVVHISTTEVNNNNSSKKMLHANAQRENSIEFLPIKMA